MDLGLDRSTEREFNPVNEASTPLRYSGEYVDTHLQQQYLRARWYDPANAQFNRLDDFRGYDDAPQSLHKYAYCHGDPVNGIDPSGEFTLVEKIVVALVLSLVIALTVTAIARVKYKVEWKWLPLVFLVTFLVSFVALLGVFILGPMIMAKLAAMNASATAGSPGLAWILLQVSKQAALVGILDYSMVTLRAKRDLAVGETGYFMTPTPWLLTMSGAGNAIYWEYPPPVFLWEVTRHREDYFDQKLRVFHAWEVPDITGEYLPWREEEPVVI